jgi:hypothetical protein
MRNILVTIGVLVGLYVAHDLATQKCIEILMDANAEHFTATVQSFFPEELGELPFDLVEMTVSAKLDEVYPEVVAECRRPTVQFRAIFGDR